MTFQLLIALAALIWLASLAACAIAIFAKRLWISAILSLLALAIGYLGLTHFQVNASKTVNGQVQWSFNSRWFFIATVVLAAFALAYAIWKHRRTPPREAAPQ
jgi:heme/copper-type cytochrome/quinol oxidase subunit 2